MLINTSEDFRRAVGLIHFHAADLKSAVSEGNWVVPYHELKDLGKEVIDVVKLYYKTMGKDIEKAQDLKYNMGLEVIWMSKNYRPSVNQVVVIIIIKKFDLEDSQEKEVPQSLADEKSAQELSIAGAEGTNLVKTLREKPEIATGTSDPQSLRKLDLRVGDVHVIDENQVLRFRAGGIPGLIFDYRVKEIDGREQEVGPSS